jgi:hypothetical protein
MTSRPARPLCAVGSVGTCPHPGSACTDGEVLDGPSRRRRPAPVPRVGPRARRRRRSRYPDRVPGGEAGGPDPVDRPQQDARRRGEPGPSRHAATASCHSAGRWPQTDAWGHRRHGLTDRVAPGRVAEPGVVDPCRHRSGGGGRGDRAGGPGPGRRRSARARQMLEQATGSRPAHLSGGEDPA